MKKKSNELKQKRVINEDISLARNLFITLVIVVLVCLGLYFFTDKLINKENNDTSTETATIDYDIATIGTMFNRIEEEYYVLLYSKNDSGSDLDSILDTYRSSDNYIKTYYIDLDKKINKSVLGEELNRKPSNSSEVKVNGPTMFRIKNGVVVNTYSGVDDIKKVIES